VTTPDLRAVLFDWDGTLVDSAEKSYRCFVDVFAAFGLPFDRARFQATYSPEWTRTYEAVGLPRERWEEADRLWLAGYASEGSFLVPGALDALRRLAERSLVLGIVSSGDGDRVRGELETLGVARYFRTVVCGGEAGRKKPFPDPLLLALSRLSLRPDDAAYVGDSPEDVEMAQAAGAFSVGIPGGFPNRPALEASHPDVLAESLAAAVDRLLG
jgi:HAD superfamily hydrolase (TIGR01549 family)